MSRIDPRNHPMDKPYPLQATKRQQAGYDIFHANCPRCGNQLAASSAAPEAGKDGGRTFCVCGVWCNLIHPDGAEPQPAAQADAMALVPDQLKP